MWRWTGVFLLAGGSLAPCPLQAETTPASQELGAAEFADISLEDLLNIKVHSGSLREETAKTVPADMTVLTANDFAQYRYLSIGEALSYVPGFYVLDDHTQANVGVRGVNGGMGAQSGVLKAMIEGRDAGFRPTGGALLGYEFIPVDAIKRVEVVRGPASALYGANAFLGVVNVVPKTANDFGAGHAKISLTFLENWGNPGGQIDVALYGKPLGIDAVFAASARADDRSGLELPTTSPLYQQYQAPGVSLRSKKDQERAASAFSRLAVKSESLGTLAIDSNVQFTDRDANFAVDASPLSDAPISLYNSGATLRYTGAASMPLTIKAFAAAGLGGTTGLDRPVDAHRSAYDYLQRTLGYRSLESRIELSKSSDRWLGVPASLSLGGDYVLDDEASPALQGHMATTGELLDISPPSQRQIFQDLGGFGEASVTPWRHVTVTAGARFEHHSQYGARHNYRAVAVADFDPVTIKLLYGSSFKAPPENLLYAVPTVVGGPQSNPNLRPQQAQTGELDIGYIPVAWLSVNANVYLTHVDDLAQVNTSSFRPQAENRAAVDCLGGELFATVSDKHLGIDAFAGASYTHSTQIVESTLAQEPRSQTELFPTWMASAGATYTPRSWHLQVMALARYASNRRADDSNALMHGSQYELQSYALLSLGLKTVDLVRLFDRPTTLSLKVDNVLDQRYVDPGFLGIDVPGNRWSLSLSLSQAI